MTRTIYLDQIIMGALTKLDTVDNFGLTLLVKDLEENVNVCKKIDAQNKNVFTSFVAEKNGIYFKNNMSNKEISNVVCTEMKDYFNSFDVSDFMQKREELFKVKQEELLNKANVLLISDEEECFSELKKYGFTKVDHFKSFIRAEKYFKENSEELEKYNIILTGKIVPKFSMMPGTLEYQIKNITNERNVVRAHIDKENNFLINMTLEDGKEDQSVKSSKLHSYFDVFDKIIKYAIINGISNEVNEEKSVSINDCVALDKFDFPKVKSDLKILCLVPKTYENYEKIFKKIGLNVTFKVEDQNNVRNDVENVLGNYDIIITSNNIWHLPYLNKESTELCKETGRYLTLLLTYNCRVNDEKLGDEIGLIYSYGGSLAPAFDEKSVSYNVLVDYNSHSIYDKTKENKMKFIIEEAVSLYNDALIKTNKFSLSDVNFKRASKYDEEYKRKEEMLEASEDNYYNIYNNVLKFIYNRKKGLVQGCFNGLEIFEDDGNTITILNVFKDRVLCSLTFNKEDPYNQGEFILRSMDEKGRLDKIENVGINSIKFLKPNLKQAQMLKMISQKVDIFVKPVNKIADKIAEENIQNKLVLKRKMN